MNKPKPLDLEIVAYAMATLVYTNGVCPFCRVKIAEKSVRISDVGKHIEKKNEYSLWIKSYKRVMLGERK